MRQWQAGGFHHRFDSFAELEPQYHKFFIYCLLFGFWQLHLKCCCLPVILYALLR
jgi:hypothetical protein